MFLFLILINDAGFSNINTEIGSKITSAVNKRKDLGNKHWKYVDDLTVGEPLNLKETLITDTEKYWERPLSFQDRKQQILPKTKSQVQEEVNNITDYAVTNEMKINIPKSKVMLFNRSRNNDFTPEIFVGDTLLQVVDQIKLLGVVITNDLKWLANTEYITKTGYARLWLIRRLKLLGASQSELLDIYVKQIRSILEFAAVVWHSGLTQLNSADIERVQKCAFSIILGKNYISYKNALIILGLTKLSDRRVTLCKHFAEKCLKSD